MADGLRIILLRELLAEPSPGIASERLASQICTRLAQMGFKKRFSSLGGLADGAYSQRREFLSSDLADARDAADLERGQDLGLRAGPDKQDSVRLC